MTSDEVRPAYEHRLWLHRATWTSNDCERELDRLNQEFGWRCVGYMPSQPTGFFILERPALIDGTKEASDG